MALIASTTFPSFEKCDSGNHGLSSTRRHIVCKQDTRGAYPSAAANVRPAFGFMLPEGIHLGTLLCYFSSHSPQSSRHRVHALILPVGAHVLWYHLITTPGLCLLVDAEAAPSLSRFFFFFFLYYYDEVTMITDASR